MKIVHICLTGTFTDHRNYQENVLTKFHSKMGHEVTVLASKWIQRNDGKGHTIDSRNCYFDENGVKVVRLHLKGKQNPYKKFKRYDGLYKVLCDEQPDFVFIHGVASVDNIEIAKYLKKHPNVKACADNHADFSNSATSWISRNILHKIIWRYYANVLTPVVNRFYGVLPARVEFLKQIYHIPDIKCELLLMGADDDLVNDSAKESVRNEIRNKYGIKDDDFLIVTGGKIDAWKTQTLLLMEAVNKLDNDKVKLIIFGSITEELKPEVEKLVDGNRIKYIGWIDANDSYKFFASAEVVAFPGRHSVFWEQVAGQGVPMICKHWEGTHHIDVGGNVIFLYKDSVDEIISAIHKILLHPEKYNEMNKVAKTKGVEVFSYYNIAEKCISGEN